MISCDLLFASRRAVIPFLCVFALVCLLCLSPANAQGGGPAPGPGDWWMYHHDAQHTGRSAFNGPATAALQWKFPTSAAVNTSPAIAANGTIYVGSVDRHLYAINIDGTMQWHFTVGSGIGSSPAVGADGTIYIGSDDKNLYAVNPDGTQKWAFTAGGAISGSPAIAPDGTIYIGSADANLYALNTDGTQKWAFATGLRIQSSPALAADGTIYVGSADRNLYAINPDGTLKWTFPLNGYVLSSPTVAPNGTIYVGSSDRNLYAINPDGEAPWAFLTGNEVTSTAALATDGTIYFGSRDGNIYAVYSNGTQKWSCAIGGMVDASSPALGADGTIFVGSTDANIYAINSSGTQKWTYLTRGQVESGPAIGANGVLYVGSSDGLYAINNAMPAITSFTPTNGPIGTVVAITGANLTGATAVAFGGSGASSFTVVSATSVTATVGNGATGVITITTPNGMASSSGKFIFTNRGDWWMFHHDPLHTGHSAFSGPDGALLQGSFATGNAISFSSPAVGADGTIYIGSEDSSLYAITPDGTTKVWAYPTLDKITSSPAIGTDGTIYVGSWDDKLYAINPDCSLQWTFATGSAIQSSPAVAMDGTIYVGSDDYYLYAINPDGTQKWMFPTNGPIHSSPVIAANGTIYVGSEDGYLYAVDFNETTGLPMLKWQFQTGGMIDSSPAVAANGVIFIGSNDGKLYALTDNGTSCTQKWVFATGGAIVSTPAITGSSIIYVGSSDGKLYALTDNGASCTQQWVFPTGGIIDSSPAIGPSGLLVGSHDGKLYNIRNGGQVWIYDTGAKIQSSPAIGPFGTIYVGSCDGSLYALQGPPIITSFTPVAGTTGTVVTISGVNFTGTTAVGIGGIAMSNITVISDTTITATVGSGATGVVRVTTPAGIASSTNGPFTYTAPVIPPAPTITAFTPGTGGTGAVVAITGTNFTGATAVVFGVIGGIGGTPAASFTVNSATTITATVGSGASGNITVTTAGGMATSASYFYFYPAAAILAFTPNSGSSGTVVTLTGTNFTSASAVTFGGTPAQSFTVINSTTITATVGNGSSGAIIVTTPVGTEVTPLNNNFSYTAPLVAVTLTPNPLASAPSGMPVNLLAAAVGGTNVQFQFQVVDYSQPGPLTWSTLQAYSTSVTCVWTPATPGNYLLSLSGKDGLTGAIVNTTAWYQVSAPLTAVTLTPSPAAPQMPGTAITLTASTTGGVNLIYQFWIYNPSATPAWSRLQAYSALNTYTWQPAAVGNYLLSVTALDSASNATASTTTWYAVTNNGPLTALSLRTEPATPQMTNTPIILTATATGGTNVQYQFWLYNPVATPAWSQLPSDSSTGTCVWTPTDPGNYFLSVTAQDGVTGTMVNATSWFTCTFGPPLTSVTFIESYPSPQAVNTAITLTATATGGTPLSVQYQFWAYNPNATPAWSQLQAYSTQMACAWTPATAGNYLLAITAQDTVTGVEVSSSAWYTIISSAPLSALSVTPSLAMPQAANTPITFTATPTGGTAVQYQFWIYNAAATPTWSQLQTYSTQATCAWTPVTPGNYLLSVTAQDSVTGVTVNTALWYTVSGLLVTSSLPSPQVVNTPITFTATAAGLANVQYQFWVYNPATTAWSQLQAYSFLPTCVWTPATAGSYLLSITARDGITGATVNSTLWYAIIVQLPPITSFTPSSGGAGTVVTLTGANFLGATAVAFGGTAAASFTVANATTITATVGTGASGTITVTTPGGMANSTGIFTFTANLTPTITSFTPSSGGAGTVVSITGANFTGATAVTFGGMAAQSFTVSNATTISATVGSGATGVIMVTTPGGIATSAMSFTMNTGPGTPGTNPTDNAALVWVPGGSFTMGSSLAGDDASGGKTQQVTLTGYWIYKYQVTVAEYLAFLTANPTYISPDSGSHLPPWPSGYSWANYSGWSDPGMQQMPIVNVSWNDAKAYATWAGVSLPTEAQYEYAARGPQENNYPWGGTATAADKYNGWDQTKCANNYNSYTQNISTWPVGSFPAGASWCGAQDLAGNVWEWCQDWYGSYSSTPVTNPTGPSTGTVRVVRGGSWNGNGEDVCRGACRNYFNPTGWLYNIGFRCASASPGP